MTIVREWERERNEINTGNLWRSPCPNKRVRLPRLLTRAKDLSRTADTTNAREGENEMNILEIEDQDKQMILDSIISAMAASKDEEYQDDLAILWRKIATSERVSV